LKSTVLLSVLAISFFASVYLALAPDQISNGLKVSPPFLDLGNVIEGTTQKGVFSIANTFDQEVKIIRVVCSCSCTGVEPDKRLLAPGEVTQVKVSFNSSSLGGVVEKDCQLFFKVGSNGTLLREPLLVTSLVSPGYSFSADVLAFKHDGGRQSQAVTLVKPSQSPILSVGCAHLAFAAESVQKKETQVVQVNFEPSRWPRGLKHSWLKVWIDNKDFKKALQLPIKVE